MPCWDGLAYVCGQVCLFTVLFNTISIVHMPDVLYCTNLTFSFSFSFFFFLFIIAVRRDWITVDQHLERCHVAIQSVPDATLWAMCASGGDDDEEEPWPYVVNGWSDAIQRTILSSWATSSTRSKSAFLAAISEERGNASSRLGSEMPSNAACSLSVKPSPKVASKLGWAVKL